MKIDIKNRYCMVHLVFLALIFLCNYLVRVFIITFYFGTYSFTGLVVGVVWTFITNLIFLIYIFTQIKKSNASIIDELRIFLKFKDLIFGIIAGFFLLLIAILMIYYINIDIESGRIPVIGPIVRNSNTLTLIIFSFYVVIFVPFVEEIIFRGYIWKILKENKINGIVILLITSVLFALVHLDIPRFEILFASGIVHGFLRLRTNRLGPSFVAHMTTNAIALLSNF